MVTGEVAFLAARLFVLESRRQINRVNDRLEGALETIEELRTLVTEHEESIGTLSERVRELERMSRLECRRNRRFEHRSSRTSGGPSTSSGDTSYGSPALRSGMVGDGVEEPYRLVLVEPVGEPEVVVREEPVTPVSPPAPLGEVEREIIEISDDEEEEVGLQGRLDRNFARWVAAGNSPSGRSSPEVQEVPSPVREGDNPPPYRSVSPAPPSI